MLPGIEHYLLMFLNSPAGMATMKRLAATTSGLYNLSVAKIRAIAFPLPPVAEQIRTREKVDAILQRALALETSLEARDSVREALADAPVAADEDARRPTGPPLPAKQLPTNAVAFFVRSSGGQERQGRCGRCQAWMSRSGRWFQGVDVTVDVDAPGGTAQSSESRSPREADARIRTADPFITSVGGPVSERAVAEDQPLSTSVVGPVAGRETGESSREMACCPIMSRRWM
jgi:hypothetical protein